MKDNKPATPPKAGRQNAIQAANSIEANCAYSEMMPIADLKHHPQNPNQHSEGQLRFIQKVLAHQGWRSPLIVSNLTGFVVCGNGRLMAARAMGLEEVPVDRQDFASEADELAHLLADNKIASLAELDNDILKEVLLELDTGAIDMDMTGFSDSELEELMTQVHVGDDAPDAEPKIDQAAELQKKWGTKLGQIWELGEHRIACGDSTSAEVVGRLMGDERAEICFTSPPYNAGSLNIKGNKSTSPKYIEGTDDMAQGDYLDFLNGFIDAVKDFSDEQFVNLGLVQSNKLALVEFMNAQKSTFKDLIYWVKNNCAPHIQQGVMNSRVELIICLGDEKRKFRNAQFSQGTRANFIEGPSANGNEFAGIHKATFPLYLPTDIIANFSNKGAMVIEPFLGSGTTLIACENLGRKCRAIELAPEYVAVAIERWHEVTGKHPELLDG